jgi:AraC-like DNA-binding protein
MSELPAKLAHTAKIIQAIFHLPFACLRTEEDIAAYSREYRILPDQTWLEKEALSLILVNSRKDSMNYFEDALRLHVILFYLDGAPILIGPYLSEGMSAGACQRLLRSRQIRSMTAEDLLIRYGTFPVIPDAQMDRISAVILDELGLSDLKEHYVFHESLGDAEAGYDDGDFARVSRENLDSHYAMEQDYMRAIESGNYSRATRLQAQLRHEGAELWSNAPELDSLRISAAVMRAMTRVAAYRAGMPASIIHSITSAAGRQIALSKSAREIAKINQDMIRSFCEYISSQAASHYSALVQSCLYAISQDYAKPLTTADLARELEVSETYLIARFHEETGQTPLKKLKAVRIERAALLLVSSNEDIQQISSRVGITDANYFTKLFRSVTGMTPREYRKRNRI